MTTILKFNNNWVGLKRGFASLIYVYTTHSSKVEHFIDVKSYNKLKTENYESTYQVLHQIKIKNCVSIKKIYQKLNLQGWVKCSWPIVSSL